MATFHTTTQMATPTMQQAQHHPVHASMEMEQPVHAAAEMQHSYSAGSAPPLSHSSGTASSPGAKAAFTSSESEAIQREVGASVLSYSVPSIAKSGSSAV